MINAQTIFFQFQAFFLVANLAEAHSLPVKSIFHQSKVKLKF